MSKPSSTFSTVVVKDTWTFNKVQVFWVCWRFDLTLQTRWRKIDALWCLWYIVINSYHNKHIHQDSTTNVIGMEFITLCWFKSPTNDRNKKIITLNHNHTQRVEGEQLVSTLLSGRMPETGGIHLHPCQKTECKSVPMPGPLLGGVANREETQTDTVHLQDLSCGWKNTWKPLWITLALKPSISNSLIKLQGSHYIRSSATTEGTWNPDPTLQEEIYFWTFSILYIISLIFSC